jgi:anti-sigma B factor antagonist
VQPASHPFKFEAAESPSGARLFKLSGPLTLSTLHDFQDAALRETKPVILDLSGVGYMDSAALGCIIRIYTACQNAQRRFAITGLTSRIRSLFELTRIDGLLPCFKTLTEADTAVTAL